MPKNDYLSDPNGTIRRRKPISQRRSDGLIRYGYDKTSQSGEDGIIERLFQLLPGDINVNSKRWCVDVGAWDGMHLSNTYSLLCKAGKSADGENDSSTSTTTTSSSPSWSGVLIEADSEKFGQLKALHDPYHNTCLNVTVSCMEYSTQRLSHILETMAPENLPKDFDFLCIDVDGTDYWLLHDILHSTFRPKVICVEFNPTMPHDLIYIQPRDDSIRNGSSLAALVELVTMFQYQLVECTCYNAFLVEKGLYETYIKSEIPFEPTIESLHEVTMGTTLYQLYDGTLKLSGCKKLLWHRIPIKEDAIQVLKKNEDRSFPFAPGANTSSNSNVNAAAISAEGLHVHADDAKVFESIAVDMSSYCRQNECDGLPLDREKCANSILDQLKRDGFAIVRGTGITQQTCIDALHATQSFLQDAPEIVRRSCLTKDRARRGYSPQNAENFASLIGEKGPNDLVKKYRVGRESDNIGGDVGGDSFALTQANAWPTGDTWGELNSDQFRSSIEKYFDDICSVAHSIVEAISDGMQDINITLNKDNDGSHTSILTLLGYKKGARHQGKHARPLVAAHTDVGVITVLLFDGGDSAMLQRANNTNGREQDQGSTNTSTSWVDVKLPIRVPVDPCFVVNIGDCLSDISGGRLPSTLHRVMPRSGQAKSPRNCLALFVGFKPDERITIDGETMTYEEWRRRRIAKAQGRT